ncbi:ATP-dependent DNA helicase PcrA [compost metagenome]
MGGRGGVRVSTPLQDAARAAKSSGAAGSGAAPADFAAGDRVAHGKWGEGVIVSVKGTGNDMELQIAFPAPVGIKRLLASYAPITKVQS